MLVDFLCLVVGDRDMVVAYLLPPQPRWQEGWWRGLHELVVDTTLLVEAEALGAEGGAERIAKEAPNVSASSGSTCGGSRAWASRWCRR